MGLEFMFSLSCFTICYVGAVGMFFIFSVMAVTSHLQISANFLAISVLSMLPQK